MKWNLTQCKIKGLVVKKFAHHFSRYGDENELLNDFLLKDNIVGIKDVDTRALISHIRENGAQNAIISSEGKTLEELNDLLKKAPENERLRVGIKSFYH